MKQIYQNVSSGETSVEEVPRPQCKKGHVLIKSTYSLISAGTERMLVDFGKSNFLDKARKQPEKVSMVLDKLKTDGIVATYDAVKTKLDQPLPMGYSNVGVVEEVGEGVNNFSRGDRVVSNGSHAEMVCVPKNLVCKIPDNVSDEDAAFTVVGSIALQGIRLSNPSIGETYVVMGLGLIGLITIQILRAHGCRVLGMDFDKKKVDLAETMGVETLLLDKNIDSLSAANDFSRGLGVDAVIITASTNSNEPVHNAALMCRKRGRIILVGVVGLDIQRNDFYEKEISFQVSCSYGPGRYDPFYEDQGNDYPIGFVRWTENRNFQAVLEMISDGRIELNQLKTETFNLEKAQNAYNKLLDDKDVLGLLIKYDFDNIYTSKTVVISEKNQEKQNTRSNNKVILALIGAGNHAGRTLLPAIKRTRCDLEMISSSQGMSSAHYGKSFGFKRNTTDVSEIFSDKEINTIVVSTQHDSHAELVTSSIDSNKNVFVEKPLCLNQQQLKDIKEAYNKNPQKILMVGFNRRFSPLVIKLKKSIKPNEPISIIYTCNAGFIPSHSWVHDPKKGGGRIIGEACHFIDICRFLTNSPIESFSTNALIKRSEGGLRDTVIINLSFKDGSIATINYFANGSNKFPKERIEVFQSGGVATIDNFKKLKSYNFSNLQDKKLFVQNKGINDCIQAFIEAVKENKESPISADEIFEVTDFSIQAAQDIKNK